MRCDIAQAQRMPVAAMRACRAPGCPAIVQTGYCDTHAIGHRQPCRTTGCGAWAIQHVAYRGLCSACCEAIERRHDAGRGSSSDRGYGGNWPRLRSRQLAQHPRCAMCAAKATQVDHVVPIARGGTHDRSNLRSLCASCHSRKTNREDRGLARG